MNRSTTSHTFVDSQAAHTNFNVSQKYKVVLLGDQSVGKTSIINRFIFDTFDGKDHVSKYLEAVFILTFINIADSGNRFHFKNALL